MPHATIEKSVSLYYETYGTGLPIVFIHPPVIGQRVFKHQKRLSEHYQTIFYDLRGHGRSSKGEAPLSILLLANDLKKLLDEIGVEKAVICGFSNGGTIAQEFALLYPERTSALILSGGYPRVNSPNLYGLIRFAMLMAKLRKVPFLAKLQAKTHKYFKEDEQDFFAYGKNADAEKVYEYCQAGLHYNASGSLYHLKMPVLLVYGSFELTMHHYRKDFEKVVPQTQVEYIKWASHRVPPRHFPQFNGAVYKFLQKQNKPSALS
ncbi:alpha/beta fold hydrolase [Planomicrobium sp. CPCC 101110]|uniref:alpha/beta fold hydrolase n=1 Tax=Planomicrobium sp. CPCC 101110 TaxID=2599619 RepID=UPI0011B620FA|nr:alpha/beta hydrolase [Planomicrobium sp. CPCC 101110]TWT24846.1 alpha/beta hydrolase [Planomicrobium sp. CPCC 101110]